MLEDLVQMAPSNPLVFAPGLFLGGFCETLASAQDYVSTRKAKYSAIGIAGSLFTVAGIIVYKHNEIDTMPFIAGNAFTAAFGYFSAILMEKAADWMREIGMRKKKRIKRTAGVRTYQGESRISKYLTSDHIPGIDYDPPGGKNSDPHNN